jgi:hypothetical protein
MADINPFFTRDDSSTVMGKPRDEQKIDPFFSRAGSGQELPTLDVEDLLVDTQTTLPEPTEEQVVEEKLQPVGTTDFDDAERIIRDRAGLGETVNLQEELLNIADPDVPVSEEYLDENIEELLPPEVPAEALADVSEPPVTDDLEATEPTVELSFEDRLTTLLDAEYDRIEEDEKFQQVIEAEAKELLGFYKSVMYQIYKEE